MLRTLWIVDVTEVIRLARLFLWRSNAPPGEDRPCGVFGVGGIGLPFGWAHRPPLAGQDAHGAVQRAYQVTDSESGHARGTPEPYRQVDSRATRPIPARGRSVRRSEAILD